MNTTAKGNEFEDKVYNYLSSMLDMDELPQANKKYSKIFKHKKYKTDTKRVIDFDITIETYNPFAKNKDEWTSLVVVECKNYNHKVDISDLDEFQTKLDCVSKFGVKGIVVTTKGFTRNEVAKAKKEHLALVVFNGKQMDWIVSRDINTKSEDKMQQLLGDKSVGYIPLAYCDDAFSSLLDVVKKFGCAINTNNIVSTPYIKREDISKIVEDVFTQYPCVSDDYAGEILCKAFPEYRIRFEAMPEGTLGFVSFVDRELSLSDLLLHDEHRRRFTMAHELGHLFLHSELMEKCMKKHADISEDGVASLPDNMVKWLEIQANNFASYLLLPSTKFIREVAVLFKELGIARRLFLDHQSCNIRDVNYVLGVLSNKFNVSRDMVKVRLLNDNLLEIDSKGPRRVDDIFR